MCPCLEHLSKTLQNNKSLMLVVLKIGADFSPANFFFFLDIWGVGRNIGLLENYFELTVYSYYYFLMIIGIS